MRRYLRSVRMFLVYRLNNTMDESNTYVFLDLKKSLREIIAEEKGMVTLAVNSNQSISEIFPITIVS